VNSNSPASIFRRPTSEPSRAKFEPSGTPKQQAGWAMQIDRRLEREIRWSNSRTASLERLRWKFAERRDAGKAPTAELLWRVFDAATSARYYVFKFVGEPSPRDRKGMLNSLFPPSAPVDVAARLAAPAVASVTTVPSTCDVAATIARDAAGEAIDWTREPNTTLERRVRARWIEHRLADSSSWIFLEVAKMLLRGLPVASDLAEAEKLATEALRNESEVRARREARDLRDEVLGEDLGLDGLRL